MKRNLKQIIFSTYFSSVLSAILLIFSFPKAELSLLAWVALIPLMLALDGKSLKESFILGYISGLVFFAGTLYWFYHVTTWFSFIAGFGITLLLLYLACYFAVFALGNYYFRQRSLLVRIFILPALWVCLEFIRSKLFTGFDWISLGHSQYKDLMLIQISDITGKYGVSFLIVMANLLFKEILSGYVKKRKLTFEIKLVTLIVFAILIGVLLYGKKCLETNYANGEIKLSVIQGNIDQDLKFDRLAANYIYEKHLRLAKEAALEKPDLIIWPETSLPGYLGEEDQFLEELKSEIKNINIPFLVGAIETNGAEYFNTALYLSNNGEIIDAYKKIHLVVFGEYLPFRRVIPFLSELVPIGDFTPGSVYKIFYFDKERKKSFSTLICFEDTVDYLARNFTKAGTGLLVNITNDAWFKDTKAPMLHLQSAVFRTIENRRSLVRAANSGVSAFIDQHGSIIKMITNKNGKSVCATGQLTQKIELGKKLTFYTKFADIFTYICFGGILINILNINIKSRRKNER